MIAQLCLILGLLAVAAWCGRQRIAEYVAAFRARFRTKPKRKRSPAKKKPASKPVEAVTEEPTKKSPAAMILAAAAGGLLVWMLSDSPTPGPTPDPVPIADLDLRGKFVGPQAATDAAALAALSEELAASVEWDAEQDAPAITTGAAFDDARIRLRSIMMRGDSIGARQPKARDAIAAYLDAKCGNSGGPLTPAQRSAWVAAYRDVARASEAAYR